MTPQDIAHTLEQNNYSYSELDESVKFILRGQFQLGVDGFSEVQTELLKNFYLLVLEEQIIELDVLLGFEGKQLPALKTKDGRLILSAYLLTDCANPDNTWFTVADFLMSCPIVKVPPEELDFGEED